MSIPVRVRLPNGVTVEVIVEDASSETVSSFKARLSEIMGDKISYRVQVDGRSLEDSELVVPVTKDKILQVSLNDQIHSFPATLHSVGNLSPVGDSTSFPSISSAMTSMLGNNPELMKAIILSHPQLKEMMNKSPQLREAMNNPQVLQDMLKLATNPQYYREAMIGADRAMSQLENIPQGFQMLRQLHEQIDTETLDPLMPKPKPKLYDSNPTGFLQTNPLPNPWASPNSIPLRTASAPPEYSSQMSELKNLGFDDASRNIEVLRHTKGNVQSAVDILTMHIAEASNESSEAEQEE